MPSSTYIVYLRFIQAILFCGWVAFLCLDVLPLKPLFLCAVVWGTPCPDESKTNNSLPWPVGWSPWGVETHPNENFCVKTHPNENFCVMALTYHSHSWQDASVWELQPSETGGAWTTGTDAAWEPVQLSPFSSGSPTVPWAHKQSHFFFLICFHGWLPTWGLEPLPPPPYSLPPHSRAALFQLSRTGVGRIWCNDN